MKRWRIGLFGVVVAVVLGGITSFASSGNEGLEYVGQAYTLQTFPYQYKDSKKYLDVYEKMQSTDVELLVSLKSKIV